MKLRLCDCLPYISLVLVPFSFFLLMFLITKDQLCLGADNRGFFLGALFGHLPPATRLYDGRTWTSRPNRRSHLAGGAHLRSAVRHLHGHRLRGLSARSRSQSDWPFHTRVGFLCFANGDADDPMAPGRDGHLHILHCTHGYPVPPLSPHRHQNCVQTHVSWPRPQCPRWCPSFKRIETVVVEEDHSAYAR